MGFSECPEASIEHLEGRDMIGADMTTLVPVSLTWNYTRVDQRINFCHEKLFYIMCNSSKKKKKKAINNSMSTCADVHGHSHCVFEEFYAFNADKNTQGFELWPKSVWCERLDQQRSYPPKLPLLTDFPTESAVQLLFPPPFLSEMFNFTWSCRIFHLRSFWTHAALPGRTAAGGKDGSLMGQFSCRNVHFAFRTSSSSAAFISSRKADMVPATAHVGSKSFRNGSLMVYLVDLKFSDSSDQVFLSILAAVVTFQHPQRRMHVHISFHI